MDKNEEIVARRTVALALGVSTSMVATGCFGSFGLSKLVYDWNDSFGSKWVKWLVFLGLNLIPIYAITLFVDTLVLNSIEFWFGSHPVSGRALPEGRRVASRPTEDPDLIRHDLYQNHRRVATLYLRRDGDDAVSLLDEQGRVLTHVEIEGGALTLKDGSGHGIAHLDRAQCERIALVARGGTAPSAAIFDELSESGQIQKVSEASARLRGLALL